MPFQSIEPRRLYRQIADQIRTLIKSGEFPAGARLPPERDLAKQLGVSRPSVREALIALEVEGLVEVRIGSGIYVQPGNEEAADGKTHEARVFPAFGLTADEGHLFFQNGAPIWGPFVRAFLDRWMRGR